MRSSSNGSEADDDQPAAAVPVVAVAVVPVIAVAAVVVAVALVVAVMVTMAVMVIGGPRSLVCMTIGWANHPGEQRMSVIDACVQETECVVHTLWYVDLA